MKKFIALWLFFLYLFLWTLPGNAWQGSSSWNVTDNSTSGAITLIAANANAATNVFKLNIAVGAADTMTFKCGATTFLTIGFTAAGGYAYDIDGVPQYCAANSAITVTKGTSSTQIYTWGKYTQTQ